MLKIITIINWIAIGILALLVGAETLFPTKGGDAAGRGMGQAIYFLAAIALVVLLVLNLLPYKFTKVAAFGILLVPFALILADSAWVKFKKWSNQKPAGQNQDGSPWFQDKQKQALALAIYDGEVEKVKKCLREPLPGLNDRAGEDEPTLLEFAVNEASYTSYREEEKVACVKLLLDAGARFSPSDTRGNPIHVAPATVGNATLLRALLEHGADPNARDVYFKRPVLFEAITSYKQANETVQVLLDAGADPNTMFVDVDSSATSALLHAAANGRWNICLRLIEKGADVRYQSSDGKTLRSLVEEADRYYSGDGYSTRADFEAVKKAIR